MYFILFIKVKSLKRFSPKKAQFLLTLVSEILIWKNSSFLSFRQRTGKRNGRFQSDCNRENKTLTSYFEKYNGKHSNNDKNFSSKSSIIQWRFVDIRELKEEKEKRRNRPEKEREWKPPLTCAKVPLTESFFICSRTTSMRGENSTTRIRAIMFRIARMNHRRK